MNRDTLAKAIYERIFKFLIGELNTVITNGWGYPVGGYIGLLDLFGFEILEVFFSFFHPPFLFLSFYGAEVMKAISFFDSIMALSNFASISPTKNSKLFTTITFLSSSKVII